MKSRSIPGAASDGTTAQRFEAKYLIPEMKARAVAAFIEPFVQRDRHMHSDDGYIVDSTYLDSPDLFLCRSSMCGERNRFKLRLRGYGSNGNGHVFVEIKRRLDQVIRKERAPVKTTHAEHFLRDTRLRSEDVAAMDEEEVLALHNFSCLKEGLDAAPKVHISYAREAYVDAFGEPVRVTFDRDIVCVPAFFSSGCSGEVDTMPFPVLMKGVVLEIKFTNGYPYWVRETIRRFNLQRQSVSKYVLAVDALRRRRICLEKE